MRNLSHEIKNIIYTYKHYVLYVFFGCMTTLVNIAGYYILAHIFSLSVMTSTILAWIIAVLFAYFTNRKWVFESDAHEKNDIFKELVYFFSCRITTGVIDWACMYILVDCMHLNDVLIKTGANLLVIVLNYIASRFLIFKKHN